MKNIWFNRPVVLTTMALVGLTLIFSFQNCTVRSFSPVAPNAIDQNSKEPDPVATIDKLNVNLVTGGRFFTFPAGTALGLSISGRALMVRSSNNTTSVTTQVVGLAPNQTYGSHVHNLPCNTGGGGHYKMNPKEQDTLQENEIWPTLQSDLDGKASAEVTVEHLARPEAQSIVIHAADGSRIACSDLIPESASTSLGGTLQMLQGGIDLALTLTGNAQITRTGYGYTIAQVRVAGLTPNVSYNAHVHNLPCADGGGAHYKINNDVVDVIQSNEIWPIVNTDAAGLGFGETIVKHVAGSSAVSIVIHDTVDPTIRIACFDLNQSSTMLLTTTGVARFPQLIASAKMVRTPDGKTRVSLNANGLTGNTNYSAHVHNEPCTTGGGGHYKIDPTIAEALPENEIWPVFRTDVNGVGVANLTSDHLARAEAQSVVIHDPTDGARLACGDLY